MDILSSPLKLLFFVLAIAGVLYPLYKERSNFDFAVSVWKKFTFTLFLQAAATLILVIALSLLLGKVAPYLNYGWYHLFSDRGGNIGIAPVIESSRSTSTIMRIVPLVFLIAFFAVVPFLSNAEEKMFRKGKETWVWIIPWSVYFGLFHCLVGVPISVGIALAIAGLYFGYKYKSAFDENVGTLGVDEARKIAVFESTVAHSMYNSIVVVVLFVALARYI